MTGGPEDRLVALARERGLLSDEHLEVCQGLVGELPPQSRMSPFRMAVLRGYIAPRHARQLAAAVLKDRMDALVEDCEPVAELGEGPMGNSFVIQHRGSGRRYVLKVFDRSVSGDPQWRARFEERAWLGLSRPHRHLVWLLGFGEKMGSVYALSEHVPGRSLAQALASVSPENLLLGEDGVVRLADLAVAKARPGELSVRKRGVGVRSPAYLSPEHLAREATPDIRSDLFSLGSVLYHCLAGEPPFQGETTGEVIFAIENGRRRPLRTLAPEAPQALVAVVEKLLATTPAERYQSAESLLADLRAVEQGRVPEAQREAIALAQRQKEAQAPQPERTRAWPPPLLRPSPWASSGRGGPRASHRPRHPRRSPSRSRRSLTR